MIRSPNRILDDRIDLTDFVAEIVGVKNSNEMNHRVQVVTSNRLV